MSSRFRLPTGGTYNVRTSELARDRHRTEALCHINLLDNTAITLRANRWLDPTKPLRKQIKRSSPYIFNFRVKFFVTDPSKLQEEYTRYHYFLQLRNDILEARLPCPHNTAALLASYIVQSELGDYSETEHLPGYLSDLRFLPRQGLDFEKEVAKLHKQHVGMTPADAEFNYLNVAKNVEFYGVELHYARDQSNVEIMVGVTAGGVNVYNNGVRISNFPWIKIVKIFFKLKHFFVQLRKEQNETRENIIGFNLGNYRACKTLWKACVEHHTFFRMARPASPPHLGFLAQYFSLGSKFRYSGRTEMQTVQYGKERSNRNRNFARSPSQRFPRRTISGKEWGSNAATAGSAERLETQSLPSRTPPGTPDISDLREGCEKRRPSSVGNLAGLATPSSQEEAASLNNHRRTGSSTTTPLHSLSLDLKSLVSSDDVKSAAGSASGEGQAPALPPKQPQQRRRRKEACPGGSGSQEADELDSRPSDSESDAILPPEVLDEPPVLEEKFTVLLQANGLLPHEPLVLVRMKPDDQGRFGFNVKGGVDQKMLVTVSRVAPGTPADLCVPRLNEGDQVILINGRDVSEHTHDQVVQFIRASTESHSGELVLLIRPSAVYEELERADSEPDFQYIPEKTRECSSPGERHVVRTSMQQLREALDTGQALLQFEQLYRKKPGMSLGMAKMSCNSSRNRYRDVLPYDATRVVLSGNEDYINANYINMEITSSSTINRYIACQGPLPSTCAHFWQMVWEQGCSLVIMLTTLTERGRPKCHQYWPDLPGSETYGGFFVLCDSEEESEASIERKLTLRNVENNEERGVTQLQYVAWPDHGVPDDSSHFLGFVRDVRTRRDHAQPVVVHCSAGIGRTGVLITMETALCLMECNESVYPLDIVRTMRDQRAMMIQTPCQYKFVCEAILRVYDEQLLIAEDTDMSEEGTEGTIRISTPSLPPSKDELEHSPTSTMAKGAEESSLPGELLQEANCGRTGAAGDGASPKAVELSVTVDKVQVTKHREVAVQESPDDRS
ncbi:tyrosine-protein phosphatase non-receptor type 4 isoform X3 [Petromyzon marinus]|uniref:tyrosine-protein phosphatase non-receptor type 4 isoform X3 n=1 Tax=Petromyzon marinus TaxID=7757 RepID=UPI003F71D86C